LQGQHAGGRQVHFAAETAERFNTGQVAMERAGRMAIQEGKVSTTSSRRDIKRRDMEVFGK